MLYADPGLTDIVGEPLFKSLHADPRWLPFLESIGKAPGQLNAISFRVTRLPVPRMGMEACASAAVLTLTTSCSAQTDSAK